MVGVGTGRQVNSWFSFEMSPSSSAFASQLIKSRKRFTNFTTMVFLHSYEQYFFQNFKYSNFIKTEQDKDKMNYWIWHDLESNSLQRATRAPTEKLRATPTSTKTCRQIKTKNYIFSEKSRSKSRICINSKIEYRSAPQFSNET